MYSFDRHFEAHVEALADGFVRLGDRDTPFTLRDGVDKRKTAREIHQQRDRAERERDELRNDPVTRDLETWQNDLLARDFPRVDTIPHDTLEDRAIRAAEFAIDVDAVTEVSFGTAFDHAATYGQFLPGIAEIRVGTDEPGFLGYRSGPVLAHEVGHAFYDAATPEPGYEDADAIFETDEEREEARRITERLHGPVEDPPVDGIESKRLSESELFAEVFASLVVEGDAAARVAPNASERVREFVTDNFDPRAGLLFDS